MDALRKLTTSIVELHGTGGHDLPVGQMQFTLHGPVGVWKVHVHIHPGRVPVIQDDLTYDLAAGGLKASRAQSLSLWYRCRGLLNRWFICSLDNGEGTSDERQPGGN